MLKRGVLHYEFFEVGLIGQTPTNTHTDAPKGEGVDPDATESHAQLTIKLCSKRSEMLTRWSASCLSRGKRRDWVVLSETWHLH